LSPNDYSSLSLFELFKIELSTHTATLSEGILSLEQDPESTVDIDTLMRAAHSIKGAAKIVQLDPVVKLAHSMEDYFLAVQNENLRVTSRHADVLLQAIDEFSQLIKVPENELSHRLTEHIDAIDALVDTLEALIKEPGIVPESTPEKAPESDIKDKKPEEKIAASARTPEEPSKQAKGPLQDQVVRVTADKMDRLMALAGQSFVETRWLQKYYDSMFHMKNLFFDMGTLLEELNNGAPDGAKGKIQSDDIHALEALHKRCMENITNQINSLGNYSGRFLNLSENLYHAVVRSRMRPFADGVQGFPRLVRDLAKKFGKRIKFELLGQSTDVDRDILEKMEAPLNHILRNAVDHGIESPEERLAAGKTEVGHIRMKASHRAGMLHVEIEDDGRGIDLEKIRRRVINKGFMTEDMAENLSEPELLDFLFLSGFSLSEKVTEISGRGVGLDVVHDMIQKVGGSVRVESKNGAGTLMHLQLPLTLSVLRTLLVDISGEPYAFPLTKIRRVLKISKEHIRSMEDRQYITVENQNIGLISACQVLGLERGGDQSGNLSVLVLSDRTHSYGVVVDRYLGEKEIFVRAIDKRLGQIPNISAASLTEEGIPLLIIDVEDMVRSIDNILSGGRLAKVDDATAHQQTVTTKRILVVDDSITVREVERKLLENKGYAVDVAVDGMDGWNALCGGKYDLVVTDIDMPRMNGIQLLKRIRQSPTLREVPVVVVSYKDREEDRLRGLDAGANYYLVKSGFHDETLTRVVADLIGEA